MTFYQRNTVSITINFLFALLCVALFINASKNQHIIENARSQMTRQDRKRIENIKTMNFAKFTNTEVKILANMEKVDFVSKKMSDFCYTNFVPTIAQPLTSNCKKESMNWFQNLDQGDKDKAVRLLSQSIQHYGCINVNEDIEKDMEQKLGINPSQTQQLFEFLYSENNENKNNIPNSNNIATQNLPHNILQPVENIMTFTFQSCNTQIISTIFSQFLTIRDLLIFRKTCTDFKTLLHPKDKTTVIFCNDFGSKEMCDIPPLMWCDLKYFMDQSYANILEKMGMLNLEENEYTVFTQNQKIILWHSREALDLYPKIIFEKIKDEFAEESKRDYELPRIYNRKGNAWAKITNDRNVITNGEKNYGGNSTHVQSQLKNVKMIATSSSAFCALLENGNVVAWGKENYGGTIPELIQTKLKNVKMIFSNYEAFSALLHDGRVVAWGDKRSGGLIPDNIQPRLQNVTMIFSNNYAFSALLGDGNVFAWGHETYGGKIPELIQTQLQNVKMLLSTNSAFATLLGDGHVFAWGNEASGGKITHQVQSKLKNVNKIFTNRYAFAALLDDGSVFTWGNPDYGGKIPDEIQTELKKNVKMIIPQRHGFKALCNNGKMKTWGKYCNL